MSLERTLVWAAAVACCVGSVLVYGGVARPDSTVALLALGALAALPLAVVFGRFLLSFRPVERGWR
ncbi:hypothetical protein HWV23_07515 [Natronomonas halophila]|uniref:hypothetical protein n=1 Tax=Natronomonas halophila TaxID=2747817 RepID=UPI0015B40E0A|nr:hypothetical protein [Natronomonas halophila]QLD85578.1 hypothetical protein HWV23_07515 [Natronomonas halophila]